MDIYENAEQLKKIPLLSGSDNAQLKLLAFTSEALNFSAGEYLFKLNDISDSVYVILQGEVDIIRDEDPENIVTLATIGKNNLLGEMGVILNLPRNASIVAKDKVLTLKIPANRFIKLVTENPDAALEVMRQLSKKILLTSEMAIATKNQLRELRQHSG
jgi:CRP/FNR family cyclic AMP-dependent transcriptional regulator